MKKQLFYITFIFILNGYSQNPLFIPSTLSGTNFNLDIQAGTKAFYTGFNTPTFGINGSFLAPTLILNKGDNITLNVHNGLNTATTIHWHGLHVAAENDGGPHQIIPANTTWSPNFTVLNEAGTFWYHPHGEGKTDLQVAKGIAGFILVKDTVEAMLNLPRNYGIDDFPILIQTKAFDVLKQIAIATEEDTALFVNGTLQPYLDVPAQVVRLRLLNGSSMRSYMLGFTNDMTFQLIGTDGGLLDAPVSLTRLRVSPGERAEILVDLTGKMGQSFSLKNIGADLPNGIYGAADVGNGMATIPDYNLNPLNGANYDMLALNVVAQTANPITTIPSSLVAQNAWNPATVTQNRTFTFAPEVMSPATMVEGPFVINGKMFNIDSMDIVAHLNTVEKWKLVNNTLVAHPFHIHDMHFFLTSINGNPVPDFEKGKKDVVLVMPNEYVEFITKWEDFADNMTPYMYHCHLLHHEDDGMMGSFLVIDTLNTSIPFSIENEGFILFPNPTETEFHIQSTGNESLFYLKICDFEGRKIADFYPENEVIEVRNLAAGMYILQCYNKKGGNIFMQKWIKR